MESRVQCLSPLFLKKCLNCHWFEGIYALHSYKQPLSLWFKKLRAQLSFCHALGGALFAREPHFFPFLKPLPAQLPHLHWLNSTLNSVASTDYFLVLCYNDFIIFTSDQNFISNWISHKKFICLGKQFWKLLAYLTPFMLLRKNKKDTALLLCVPFDDFRHEPVLYCWSWVCPFTGTFPFQRPQCSDVSSLQEIRLFSTPSSSGWYHLHTVSLW